MVQGLQELGSDVITQPVEEEITMLGSRALDDRSRRSKPQPQPSASPTAVGLGSGRPRGGLRPQPGGSPGMVLESIEAAEF